MTDILEARDTINLLFKQCVESIEMREVAGVLPVVFWEGVSYDDGTTSKPCISVSHKEVRESKIIFMGQRKYFEEQMAVFEIRVPSQIKNGNRIVAGISKVIEKFLCVKNINGVNILNSKLTNGGIEDGSHVACLCVFYNFVRSLE